MSGAATIAAFATAAVAAGSAYVSHKDAKATRQAGERATREQTEAMQKQGADAEAERTAAAAKAAQDAAITSAFQRRSQRRNSLFTGGGGEAGSLGGSASAGRTTMGV